MMCGALCISPSGFYAKRKNPISKRESEDKMLTEEIKQAHNGSRKTYGSPRIHACLVKKGIRIGRHRVSRLMRLANIRSKMKRKFRITTDSKHNLPVVPNILQRDFSPKSANQAWAQDITYIWTEEGWMYLAVVIDLFSRKVVGWSMQDNMRKGLVIDALAMAIKSRKPGLDLIAHSDRGSQYCSHLFQSMLKGHNMICSMSGKGECWDNAVAESFFHSLKTEHIYFNNFETRAEATQSIFEFIEVFYNRNRLHSTLGFCSPVEYEAEVRNVA
jgi:putative transposase